ncbi:hypothetical protein [Glycomyces dulcitolivorans]|uniref:hypothetical protein n=1 Tax=Glycomyces dulcitolivorans TaxID=2200759 RepID=UPI0013008763|nr:hypothetical protein [Glycomyces dulcitolivorans]
MTELPGEHLAKAIAALDEADRWRSLDPRHWPRQDADDATRLAFHDAGIKSARLHVDIAKLTARRPFAAADRARDNAESAETGYPNAGHRWRPEDQDDLLRYWDVGVPVAAIAVALGRKPSAIETRLRQTLPAHPRTIAELADQPIVLPENDSDPEA